MRPTAALTRSLEHRACALVAVGERRILGITGPPGAGKSTLARELVAAIGDRAALVPMDGFHLADSELERLGLAERKGAIDTFDVAGYISLLERLRLGGPGTAYAPEFRREIEAPVADAIVIPAETPLLVTEGNYLLADEEPWAQIGELLDECWYVEVADATRIDRLTARHMANGRSPEKARAWVRDVDELNAAVVRATRDRADLVITPA